MDEFVLINNEQIFLIFIPNFSAITRSNDSTERILNFASQEHLTLGYYNYLILEVKFSSFGVRMKKNPVNCKTFHALRSPLAKHLNN